MYLAGLMRGLNPSLRKVRLTECALRHASMPTTQGGSFSTSFIKDRRRVFRQRRTPPTGSKPTRWKTSFPISRPIDESAVSSFLDAVALGCLPSAPMGRTEVFSKVRISSSGFRVSLGWHQPNPRVPKWGYLVRESMCSITLDECKMERGMSADVVRSSPNVSAPQDAARMKTVTR